jgi:precorrin-2/cobalt-factor-2 C20-methyltransferase
VKAATLYGLGVGPGDPELITLKAARILAKVEAIAYVGAGSRPSRARAIAAAHIQDHVQEIAIALPMSVDPATADPFYAAGAEQIAATLDEGRQVAVLCEGDPLFYGSFARLLLHLEDRIAGRHRIEIVPGITSVSAAIASSGHALVRRQEPLAIVPAPLACADLDARLGQDDAVVVMKLGRHLHRVRGALARAGRLTGALYVEAVSTEGERVMPLAELADEEAPYFSLVLVPPRRGAA